MSFLDTYVKKYRLDKMDKKKKTNLENLETKLDKTLKRSGVNASFSDVVKEHAEQIGDLIERVSQHFDDWEFSWRTAISSLQFVYNIAIEVYQIVEQMRLSSVTSGMSSDQEWNVKVQFGRELVYFVWMTVGPLDKMLNWMPFKKTIEKRLVLWIGGMGMAAARCLFTANKDVRTFSANITSEFVKAL